MGRHSVDALKEVVGIILDHAFAVRHVEEGTERGPVACRRVLVDGFSRTHVLRIE